MNFSRYVLLLGVIVVAPHCSETFAAIFAAVCLVASIFAHYRD